MQNLETRLAKLEAGQQARRRTYTDMERAVRLAYLLEQGEAKAGPELWAKLTELGLTRFAK